MLQRAISLVGKPILPSVLVVIAPEVLFFIFLYSPLASVHLRLALCYHILLPLSKLFTGPSYAASEHTK